MQMLLQILSIPTAAILLVILTFIIFLSPLLLNLAEKLQQNKWGSKKLPPGPKPLPIIGNLHMLFGKHPNRSLEALATKYGPIMSLKLGQVPAVVVSSSEVAQLFLKTHDIVFANRPKLQLAEIIPYARKGFIFTDYGDYWRHVRKLCAMQFLSASKIEMFGPLRNKELGVLVNTLKKASNSGDVVDLSELIDEVVANIADTMILGGSKDDKFDTTGIIFEAMHSAGAFNLGDYFPILGLFDLQGLQRTTKKAFQLADEVMEKIINDHQQPSSAKSPNHNKDLIDILLSHMNQSMEDSHDHHEQRLIGRTNIKAIAMDMTAAAYDTSKSTFEWGMSELLKNPTTMKKLQKEIEDLVGINRQVEEEDLDKLPYLDMVVKEILRLHPPVPFLLPHESSEDVTINGYFIEKNTRILVNVWQ
ncbi:hypothetical protein PIB30_080490 [Stylosanthes scabra]|uniref:Cytochrome P450 n=1 Tax=Stylosanthes scabra TaxID=79078 RepID=A0ABU6WRC0_9FABA|nr:hypothetical protein [Stylosanthes scabra]